jgi:hypothetical protein
MPFQNTRDVFVSREDGRIIVGRLEAFHHDSSVLTDSHRKFLDEFAERIKGLAGTNQLVLEGQADKTGKAEYNLSLSVRRAAAVKAYLQGKKLANLQIAEPTGVGFSKAATAGSNPKDRAVEFRLNLPHVVARELRMTVGTISWIRGIPNPFTSGALGPVDAEFGFDPDWVPKTYLGLAATRNPPPEATPDFTAARQGRQFRAMTFCHFSLQVDADDRIRNFKVLNAFHDPGFTPPFNAGALPAHFGDLADLLFSDGQFHAGEASSLSLVNTEARHANTTITDVPPEEVVLVDSLIKFRAGKVTDDIGRDKVGAPFHVPWVWCESVVTYAGNGVFKLYGRGSIFPTHSFYLDGHKVATIDEVGDATFPKLPGTRKIEVSRLRLFPVLSKGAAAAGPQPPTQETLGGSVETHPNTATGGREVKESRSIP